MFIDGRDLAEGHEVQTDVCVVGAGAAGITLARELMGSRLDVVLLESGGLETEPATTDLNKGSSVGRRYMALDETRTRCWGGSTNCWGGMCTPLDPIDFTRRDWVPHSGWPFDYEHLRPFYRRAHELPILGPFQYRGEWATGVQLAPFDFGPDAPLSSGMFQMSRTGLRFGRRYRRQFERDRRVRVLLHANVTRLNLNEAGTALGSVSVRVLQGPRFTVRARYFVLATGGLEVPRILLTSNDVQKAGVGNQHDNVGRFFMDHPHTDWESVLVSGPALAQWDYYRKHTVSVEEGEHAIWGFLRPTERTMVEERMLDGHCVLFDFQGRGRVMKERDNPLMNEVQEAITDTDGDDGARASEDGKWRFTFGTASEPAPNRNSRITPSDEQDALGMRRIQLDWQLSPLDKRSIRRLHELIADCFGRAGLGRVRLTLSEDDETWPRRMHGGRHHMGTARMHEDPKQGVCNGDGRVHGVDNLYVAGSALFPTSGAANPTLTILALALRAADHLKQRLRA